MKNNRRQILKKAVTTSAAITGLSVLPSGWKKPMINAVMLPAHAQTSATNMVVHATGSSGDPVAMNSHRHESSLLAKSVNALIPQAYADAEPTTYKAYFAIFPIDGKLDRANVNVHIEIKISEGCEPYIIGFDNQGALGAGFEEGIGVNQLVNLQYTDSCFTGNFPFDVVKPKIIFSSVIDGAQGQLMLGDGLPTLAFTLTPGGELPDTSNYCGC